MKLRKISKYMILALTLSLSIMSGSPKVYADESSGTEKTEESETGRSLFETLSRIYGGSRSSENSESSGDSSSSSTSNSSKSSSDDGTDELMQEMETGVKGPKVNEGGISETYHEGYKVYEESINEDISVFTNIANGSVVNHAVVIEIPDGVVARMKKDGKSVPITSDQPISDAGSYVVTFYVMEEDQEELPFSQQSISKAKFRFRIQYRTGVAGYDAVDDSKPDFSTGGIPDFSGLSYNPDGSISGNITGSISGNRTVSDNTSVSDADAELLFGDDDEMDLPDDLRPDDYEYDLDNVNEDSAETEDNAEAGDISFLAENAVSGEYDPDSGLYKNTTLTNKVFYTNISNGMITNDPVMIQEADDLTYTVYRNGEIYEDFVPGQYIRDEGNYRLLAVASDNETPAIFRFRIIVNPVSDMGIINAPENSTFRIVRYEGEDVSSSAIIKDETIRLIQDGHYEITIDTPGGSTEVILSLDTVQPRFAVALQPNLATITYKSDDLSYCTLYRNGELVSDSSVIEEIKEPGEYTMTAYDRAGNSSSATFRVSYRVNAAAVMSILMVLAIIGGIIFYLLRIRKKFKVV